MSNPTHISSAIASCITKLIAKQVATDRLTRDEAMRIIESYVTETDISKWEKQHVGLLQGDAHNRGAGKA